MIQHKTFLFAAGLLLSALAGASGRSDSAPLAIHARKVLTCAPEAGVIDNAIVLVKDGKIERVGAARGIDVPEGYEHLDLADLWLAPGLIDLHNHTAGGIRDLNDMVYLTNPGLRASASITPNNELQQRAVAGGVTTVLLIPGSGTNMGGQGILLKTAGGGFEDLRVRDPGSLKLAQAGNPERWLIGPGRSFMNYNTRNTFQRGLAYARRRAAGEKVERDIQFDVFPDLLSKKTQVSTHTQIYQVVLTTITMVRRELGLDVFIDHGTFDGYLASPEAEKSGVPAILGPRQVQAPRPPFIDTDGRINGVAAGYQERGHTRIGFNTDAVGGFGIGQEELSLQAAVGCRYGFDNSRMDAVRGVTSVPATTAGLGETVGTIEAGKDADLIVVTGDPLDPRTSVEMVMIRGRLVYDTRKDARRW